MAKYQQPPPLILALDSFKPQSNFFPFCFQYPLSISLESRISFTFQMFSVYYLLESQFHLRQVSIQQSTIMLLSFKQSFEDSFFTTEFFFLPRAFCCYCSQICQHMLAYCVLKSLSNNILVSNISLLPTVIHRAICSQILTCSILKQAPYICSTTSFSI